MTDTTDSTQADFELALYLVASARDCLDEPLIYGPFRMIEGVSKLLAPAATPSWNARRRRSTTRSTT